MKKDLLESSFMMTFSQVPDPRVKNRCKYKLVEIIAIVLCGVMCGCESWDEIEEFALEREDWFRKFFALEDGLPSHDTLARCFSLIEAELFEGVFRAWVSSLKGIKPSKTLAIDGKAVAGTHRGFNDGTYPLYLVNVVCHETGLTLSQEKATGPGHGEIFAAEACLEKLLLEGTIVTMDAGIAVNRIAQKIQERGGDYVLPIKRNQRHTLKVVEDLFLKKSSKATTCETRNRGHGREEARRCSVLKLTSKEHEFLENWPGLKTAVKLERERTELKSGETTIRTDYHISSRALSSEDALQMIRGHWSIENKVHWALDVAFREDSWKVRQRIAAQNLSLARKICLNILQRSTDKGSKRIKMKRASWNPDYLYALLSNAEF